MGNSFLLIIAGLLIFYLVISDKWKCVEVFFACINDKQNSSAIAPTVNVAPQTNSLPQINTSQISVPNFGTLAMNSNFANYGF